MNVVAWLRGLGLERYAPAFRDYDIDGEVLPKLTSDDLISIGVTSVGHRRKLLAAIASLGATPPAATVIAAPRDAPTAADAERRSASAPASTSKRVKAIRATTDAGSNFAALRAMERGSRCAAGLRRNSYPFCQHRVCDGSRPRPCENPLRHRQHVIFDLMCC